jgi:outer membrane biosynthesis protein TonB
MPTKTKPKPKAKPKPKPKPKPKQNPKAKPKPKEKEKKGLTFEIDNPNETINENKYALKVKTLVERLKSKSVDTDNRIRFCWKN